ncbi:AAEL013426-PA [Aedes aegypti]|uniref:AAEL013426-PA n=1 Tax=Aedes aegypti TaxID=7159 RepID=Q16J61_AEDAE|nr:AAEL013426-PA [Aedes aegypti]
MKQQILCSGFRVCRFLGCGTRASACIHPSHSKHHAKRRKQTYSSNGTNRSSTINRIITNGSDICIEHIAFSRSWSSQGTDSAFHSYEYRAYKFHNY